MRKRKLKLNYIVAAFITSLVLATIILYSCNIKTVERKVERSFYYWKSVVKLTPFESRRLDSLHVKTIFLKFFDVDRDPVSGQPVPVAKLHLQDKHLVSKYHIIPTIFITNASIEKADSLQTALLANKVYGLIKDICEINNIDSIDEIQVDCDWTASTSKSYFSFLRSIKQLSKVNLSATIRLHQIKFLSKSGVPPVDRGMLMCYNMGNLKNPSTKNSIIETRELKKYTGNISTYPLPLDVAFPLFGWKVLFRENFYKGIIENLPADIFTNSFTVINKVGVEILKDTILAGYQLKKGDVLRSEESNITEVMLAAKEINKLLKNTPLKVSLYHIDSVTLNKYTSNELENIYTIFR